MKYAVTAEVELSLRVAKNQVLLDGNGKVWAPDSTGTVKVPVRGHSRSRTPLAFSIVKKGLKPQVLESFRISLPESELLRTQNFHT